VTGTQSLTSLCGHRSDSACVVVPGRFVAFQFAGGREAHAQGEAGSELAAMETAAGPHQEAAELEAVFRAWGVGDVVCLGEQRCVLFIIS
jgi:hypothetical protein